MTSTAATATRIPATVETAVVGTIVYKGNGKAAYVVEATGTYCGEPYVALVKLGSTVADAILAGQPWTSPCNAMICPTSLTLAV